MPHVRGQSGVELQQTSATRVDSITVVITKLTRDVDSW